ncbi:DNA internalization-related competence protein ComEC/Rec2 [Geoalkalibacter halelectricus]|uniref:DNA internalization-related competence protein ComEC/Rec2 n=1 Tax=Geoalkalibacter halelectricus TaxID=2847045 RepID=UPI003D20BD12
MSSHGVLPWLLAFCAGIATAPFGLHAPWMLIAVPAATGLVYYQRRHPVRHPLAAGLFFFCTGYLLYGLALTPEPGEDLRVWAQEGEVLVEAEVLNVGRRDLGKGYVDLLVLSVRKDGLIHETSGRLRLFHEGGEARIFPGDHLRFRARLRQAYNFGTPGEFDYPRYLAARGIWITAYLKSIDEAALLPRAKLDTPRRIAGYWRQQVLVLIDQATPCDTAALLGALLVGEKGAISSTQREVLARGGISHLFSISGLHLGLIGFYAYHLVFFFWRRSELLLLYLPPRRYLPLFLLPVLLAYFLFTGEALPTRRAFAMAAVGAVLWLYSRRTAPLNVLWAAALIFLLFEPLLLFEASFQLSFAGVAGIMLLLPHWSKKVPQQPFLLRWFFLLGLTTLAATLATLPLTLLHFHMLAPAALLTNLLAVPLIGLVAVPLGLAAILLTPWWETGAKTLLALDGLVVQATFDLVAWLVSQPLLAGWRLYPTPREMLGVFLFAAILLLWYRLRPHLRVAVGLCACLLIVLPTSRPAQFEVVALSVGQGDATLLRFVDGRNILVDGGGLRSDTFDVGERLVAPALGYFGVRHLDAVMLTHDHPDHRKGLHFILEQFSVGEFWAPAPLDELDAEFVGILSRRQVPVKFFDLGWTFMTEGAGRELAIFRGDGRDFSLNDQSLVLYAAHGGEAVLLTGDLESLGVAELLLHPFPGPVSLLKLPHHGSGRSNTETLVTVLRPQATFASSGRNNVFGHPAAALVGYLEEVDIPLARTDIEGSLRMRSDGSAWTIQRWERGAFR